MEEDKTIPFHIEFLAIDSVLIPEYIVPGYEYEITITYRKPTDCYYFQGFYYQVNGPEHILAPQTMVLEVPDCQPLDGFAPEQETFTFECGSSYQYDHYIFKFYTGEDQVGNQSFHSVEIPVMN